MAEDRVPLLSQKLRMLQDDFEKHKFEVDEELPDAERIFERLTRIAKLQGADLTAIQRDFVESCSENVQYGDWDLLGMLVKISQVLETSKFLQDAKDAELVEASKKIQSLKWLYHNVSNKLQEAKTTCKEVQNSQEKFLDQRDERRASYTNDKAVFLQELCVDMERSLDEMGHSAVVGSATDTVHHLQSLFKLLGEVPDGSSPRFGHSRQTSDRFGNSAQEGDQSTALRQHKCTGATPSCSATQRQVPTYGGCATDQQHEHQSPCLSPPRPLAASRQDREEGVWYSAECGVVDDTRLEVAMRRGGTHEEAVRGKCGAAQDAHHSTGEVSFHHTQVGNSTDCTYQHLESKVGQPSEGKDAWSTERGVECGYENKQSGLRSCEEPWDAEFSPSPAPGSVNSVFRGSKDKRDRNSWEDRPSPGLRVVHTLRRGVNCNYKPELDASGARMGDCQSDLSLAPAPYSTNSARHGGYRPEQGGPVRKVDNQRELSLSSAPLSTNSARRAGDYEYTAKQEAHMRKVDDERKLVLSPAPLSTHSARHEGTCGYTPKHEAQVRKEEKQREPSLSPAPLAANSARYESGPGYGPENTLTAKQYHPCRSRSPDEVARGADFGYGHSRAAPNVYETPPQHPGAALSGKVAPLMELETLVTSATSSRSRDSPNTPQSSTPPRCHTPTKARSNSPLQSRPQSPEASCRRCNSSSPGTPFVGQNQGEGQDSGNQARAAGPSRGRQHTSSSSHSGPPTFPQLHVEASCDTAPQSLVCPTLCADGSNEPFGSAVRWPVVAVSHPLSRRERACNGSTPPRSRLRDRSPSPCSGAKILDKPAPNGLPRTACPMQRMPFGSNPSGVCNTPNCPPGSPGRATPSSSRENAGSSSRRRSPGSPVLPESWCAAAAQHRESSYPSRHLSTPACCDGTPVYGAVVTAFDIQGQGEPEQAQNCNLAQPGSTPATPLPGCTSATPIAEVGRGPSTRRHLSPSVESRWVPYEDASPVTDAVRPHAVAPCTCHECIQGARERAYPEAASAASVQWQRDIPPSCPCAQCRIGDTPEREFTPPCTSTTADPPGQWHRTYPGGNERLPAPYRAAGAPMQVPDSSMPSYSSSISCHQVQTGDELDCLAAPLRPIPTIPNASPAIDSRCPPVRPPAPSSPAPPPSSSKFRPLRSVTDQQVCLSAPFRPLSPPSHLLMHEEQRPLVSASSPSRHDFVSSANPTETQSPSDQQTRLKPPFRPLSPVPNHSPALESRRPLAPPSHPWRPDAALSDSGPPQVQPCSDQQVCLNAPFRPLPQVPSHSPILDARRALASPLPQRHNAGASEPTPQTQDSTDQVCLNAPFRPLPHVPSHSHIVDERRALASPLPQRHNAAASEPTQAQDSTDQVCLNAPFRPLPQVPSHSPPPDATRQVHAFCSSAFPSDQSSNHIHFSSAPKGVVPRGEPQVPGQSIASRPPACLHSPQVAPQCASSTPTWHPTNRSQSPRERQPTNHSSSLSPRAPDRIQDPTRQDCLVAPFRPVAAIQNHATAPVLGPKRTPSEPLTTPTASQSQAQPCSGELVPPCRPIPKVLNHPPAADTGAASSPYANATPSASNLRPDAPINHQVREIELRHSRVTPAIQCHSFPPTLDRRAVSPNASPSRVAHCLTTDLTPPHRSLSVPENHSPKPVPAPVPAPTPAQTPAPAPAPTPTTAPTTGPTPAPTPAPTTAPAPETAASAAGPRRVQARGSPSCPSVSKQLARGYPPAEQPLASPLATSTGSNAECSVVQKCYQRQEYREMQASHPTTHPTDPGPVLTGPSLVSPATSIFVRRTKPQVDTLPQVTVPVPRSLSPDRKIAAFATLGTSLETDVVTPAKRSVLQPNPEPPTTKVVSPVLVPSLARGAASPTNSRTHGDNARTPTHYAQASARATAWLQSRAGARAATGMSEHPGTLSKPARPRVAEPRTTQNDDSLARKPPTMSPPMSSPQFLPAAKR